MSAFGLLKIFIECWGKEFYLLQILHWNCLCENLSDPEKTYRRQGMPPAFLHGRQSRGTAGASGSREGSWQAGWSRRLGGDTFGEEMGWRKATVETVVLQQERTRDRTVAPGVPGCVCGHARVWEGEIWESERLWGNFRLYNIWRKEERDFKCFVNHTFNFL